MPCSFYPSGSKNPSQPSIKEPIAIIGIGCRFPGGANCPQDFWKMLSLGVNAISPVPPDRWQIRSFYDPDPAKPGKSYVRFGGFIKDIDQFDAGFFGISPREASRMDPQQRLLLEVAYEALEDAGLQPEGLAGSNTGVFVGISTCDYGGIQTSATERRSIDAYTNLGLAMCIAANRISYLFDFHGPSFAVDTACSSSLVAVHLACRGIWSGECEMALTGGVNAILRPEGTIGFSKASMLSPSGSCKSFDSGADGYVRAEGAGIIVLKPLSKALADGDPIYAVIRGTAINQDGRTGGIAFPNRLAQESILKEVYEQAGILPEQVHYIEAHGTGTSAGDPIEVNAIGNALTKSRPPGNECIIGSVKTNIGHLEAASGIAGLIKVALSLKHGRIPANLHFETPNPDIDFETLRIRIPRVLEPWPSNGSEPRFAGVNSFGFGGTNAHVILGTAPESHDVRPVVAAPSNSGPFVFPVSARSGEALQAFAHSLLGFLTDKTQSDFSLSDICYTASLRRGHHDYRLAIATSSKEGLTEYLEAFLAGETRLGMSSGRSIPGKSHKPVFVFSGMGPQWWAMGRELLEEEPVFREAIEKCDELLRKYSDLSLLNELRADKECSRIHETQIAQPAIFSIQIALAALWRSWGIEPDVVLGHSVGEVAAAYVSGALNLEDAVRVIFNRSRLQQRTAGQGAMLAVGLTFEEAENLIKGYEEQVSLGAVNSPSDVTLSGDADALKEISESLEKKEIFSRFLQVEVPYHSPKMEPLKAELLESLKGIRPQLTAIPMFSTVTGLAVEGPELDGTYWCKNIRNPVLFANAIDELIQADYNLFLEIGPHPVLAASISKCLSKARKEGTVTHSLRRQEPERATMLASLGRLYAMGYPVDWIRFYPRGGHFVKLPTYPWQKERHWHESEKSRRERLGQKVHPLLGSQVESAHTAWAVELSSIRICLLI
ncbi:MAG: type I polyketide synthase [Candidatus Dadabacteria bacterium]|nr:type I polyketide synthase [Candidatus Dadabacteria bacterium]